MVTATLVSAGFEAYVVGGSVRDLVLGKEPKDYDVTTKSSPQVTTPTVPKVFS